MLTSTAPIIIIDDDPIFVELLAEVAMVSGYQTEMVSDFHKFKKVYEKTTYDVITLDISMPDTDGFEMINELVKLECKSQIVIISGHDEALMYSAEMFAKEKGLNILVSMRKPIEVDEFENLLNLAKILVSDKDK